MGLSRGGIGDGDGLECGGCDSRLSFSRLSRGPICPLALTLRFAGRASRVSRGLLHKIIRWDVVERWVLATSARMTNGGVVPGA